MQVRRISRLASELVATVRDRSWLRRALIEAARMSSATPGRAGGDVRVMGSAGEPRRDCRQALVPNDALHVVVPAATGGNSVSWRPGDTGRHGHWGARQLAGCLAPSPPFRRQAALA